MLYCITYYIIEIVNNVHMFICTALLKYSLNGCSIGFMVIFSRDIDKVCSREVPKFHRNFKMYNAEWPSQQ